MNTLIDRLIRLNIELEGALRVAADRPSAEALEAAKEKFAQLSALFCNLDIPEAEAEQQHQQTELKYDEAENGEAAPMAEPAEAEIPVDAPVVESDAEAVEVEPREDTEQSAKTVRPDLRRQFTLNDKFLFRRELFGGSDAEMTDTLDMVGAMHSYDEAREYFFDDLQWNPDDDTVKDFMAIIANYFNS